MLLAGHEHARSAIRGTSSRKSTGAWSAQWTTRDEPRRRASSAASTRSRSTSASTGVRFATVPQAQAGRGACSSCSHNAFQTPTFMIQPDILRPHPADGRHRPRAHGAELGHEQPAADRAARSHGRAGGARRRGGVPADPVPDATCAPASGPSSPSRRRRSTSTAATCSASYLDTIDDRLNGDTAPSDEVRALLRGELRALDAQIRKALPVVTDEVVAPPPPGLRAIRSPMSLDPRAMRTRTPPPAGGPGGRGGGF